MSKLHLKQPGSTYSDRGPFTKYRKRMKKQKKTYCVCVCMCVSTVTLYWLLFANVKI